MLLDGKIVPCSAFFFCFSCIIQWGPAGTNWANVDSGQCSEALIWDPKQPKLLLSGNDLSRFVRCWIFTGQSHLVKPLQCRCSRAGFRSDQHPTIATERMDQPMPKFRSKRWPWPLTSTVICLCSTYGPVGFEGHKQFSPLTVSLVRTIIQRFSAGHL
jgi:hypothetical protein